MPQACLLRMEGVNLGAVLADTSQISVIRGSSLLLRQAVKDVQHQFALQPVSVGASVGLFMRELATGQSTDAVVQEVADYLSRHADYRHLTFVVDALPFDGNFPACREKLIGMNRLRQLQQVTVAVPDWSRDGHLVACAYDGLRPVNETAGKKVGEFVSESVASRFDFGRAQRQRFYAEELGLATLEQGFTDDLQALSDDDSKGNLHRKVAVIYLDGNRFGAIQQTHCTTIAAQQAFDRHIQQLRRGFLRTLVDFANTDPDFQTDDHKLRLEVLLWGGDEILLVVPAWKGMDTLQLFYQTSRDWVFKGEPLTHAGGIVFSQSNTPLYRLRSLAEDLANGVKQQQRANRWDYLILESMDFPAESLTSLRQRQFAHLADSRAPLLPFSAEALKVVHKHLEQGAIPRSQLMSLAYTALHKPAEFDKKLQRLATVLTEQQVQTVRTDLESLFGQTETVWPWLHLAELWDYLDTARQEETAHA
ncbi:Cas10/Cmr2 second palm domain-containing protein [Thiothrix eikelboomii]|uniref:Cas10/Cmr2 second palm domain-containing protein n=1 Tax=Thiothrix eikelboomii TaxID=92487 RepID=UPI003BAFA197